MKLLFCKLSDDTFDVDVQIMSRLPHCILKGIRRYTLLHPVMIETDGDKSNLKPSVKLMLKDCTLPCYFFFVIWCSDMICVFMCKSCFEYFGRNVGIRRL